MFAVIASCCCAFACPTHSQAIIQVDPIDNTSGGAALAGFNTFDINLISSGDTWTGSQLFIELDTGSFFRSAMGTADGLAPNPAFFPIFPDLEFDTYLVNGSPTSLGALDLSGSATATYPSQGGNILDEYWFSTPGAILDLTDLHTARITVSDDASGTLRYLASVDGALHTFEHTGDLGLLTFGANTGRVTGDLNVTGNVSQADLDLVLLNWGNADTPDNWIDEAQFSGPVVGQAELDRVLLNWGDQAPPPTLPQPDPFAEGAGDYNDDGFVSAADLDLALLNWGDSVLPPGMEAGSLGGGAFDGLISQNEVDGVLLNWGNGLLPSATAVPEPSMAALLTIGLVGVMRRRR